MVCSKVDPAFLPTCWFKFGRFWFECVSHFRYLGLVFDSRSNVHTMINKVCDYLKNSMYWMIKFFANNRWNLPLTRLILTDVYVWSILQFGSLIWGPAVISSNCLIEHSKFKPLAILYRRILRNTLLLNSRTHTPILYILATRVPF